MSFLRQSFSTLSTQVVLMVVGMLTSIIVARELGPTLKGQAALLTLVTQLLFMVGSMGLGTAFSFQTAKRKYPPRQILTGALVGAVLLGSGAIGIFYLAFPLYAGVWEGISSRLVLYSALLAIVGIYTTYLTRILVGYGRIYSMNIGDLTRSLTNFAGVVLLLVVWNFGLGGVVTSFWMAALAQTLVVLYFLRANLRPTRFWGGGFLRDSLTFGIKSQSLLLINFLNYRVDMLLLKHFSTDSAVGYYSLAVAMAELMWLVPNAAVAPLFSGIASSESVDRSVVTLRTVRWTLIFLVLLAAGGVLLGRPFIQLLYGANFLPSYVPFLWLLPGICLFPVFKLLAVDLTARGNPGYGTIASMIALLTNIAANIFLIPRMGTAGAALATSLSYSLMSLLCLGFFIRQTGYRLKQILTIDEDEMIYLRNKGHQIMKGFPARLWNRVE